MSRSVACVSGFVLGAVALGPLQRYRARKTERSDRRTYDLIVRLRLVSTQAVAQVLARFDPLCRYCNNDESATTVTYEAFVDEADPCAIVIVERYVSQHALTGIHHKSPAFIAFSTWLRESGLVADKQRFSGRCVL